MKRLNIKGRVSVERAKRFALHHLYCTRGAYQGMRREAYIGAVDSRCAISTSHKYVYQRIPKAANSSVLASLYWAQTEHRAENQEDIRWIRKSYSRPSRFSRDQITDIHKNFFCFTFVRHPIDRIMSAYGDKIVRSEPQKLFVSEFLGRGLHEPIGFSEFVDYLDHGGLYDDPHWAPQTELMYFPVEELDYVGRVEDFNEGIDFVLKQIFGRARGTVSWRPHRTSSSDGFGLELTNSDRSNLERLYAEDLARLPY